MPNKEIPKYGTDVVIQFVGLNDLTIEEQEIVQKLSTEYYAKIKREMASTTGAIVHIKHYEKEGGRRKYTLHVRVNVPTKIIESTEADDWDLARAVHIAFEEILQQIRHTFHTDVSHHKSYC